MLLGLEEGGRKFPESGSGANGAKRHCSLLVQPGPAPTLPQIPGMVEP